MAILMQLRRAIPEAIDPLKFRGIAYAVTVCALLACLLLRPALAFASDIRQPTEHEVKVALLYKFAKFVEWSEEALQGSATFRLCLLGDSPFGDALKLLHGKQIKNRPLEVHYASDPGEAHGCHIIFVGGSWEDRFEEVLDELATEGVLFVGDSPGFAKQGGVMEFTMVEGHVSFVINPQAAQREGLFVSSKLMRLARIIEAE